MRSVGLAAYQPRIEAMDRASAATALSSDVGAELSLKLDELRTLEAQHADLSRELEANEEVERLLRP